VNALHGENILTRRANQRHYSTIAQFLELLMALPDEHFGAISGQKSRQLKLHRLARST
jgi:hypothetical protein